MPLVQDIPRQGIICHLIHVNVLRHRMDWVVRDDVDASFGPHFLFRRMINVGFVISDPSSIINERINRCQLFNLFNSALLMNFERLMRFHIGRQVCLPLCLLFNS